MLQQCWKISFTIKCIITTKCFYFRSAHRPVLLLNLFLQLLQEKVFIFWRAQRSVLLLNELLQLFHDNVLFLECSKIRFTIKLFITVIAGEGFIYIYIYFRSSKTSFISKCIITNIAGESYYSYCRKKVYFCSVKR